MYFSVDWFTRICILTTNHWNQTLQTGSFGFLASFGAAPAAAAPAAPASSANFSKSKASNTAEAAFLFERGIHGSFGGACKAKHLQARFIAHLCISDLCTLTFWVKWTRSGCCISMLTTGGSQDLSHPKRLNPFANWSFCTHQRWQHRRWRVLPPRMMRNRLSMATPLKPRAMQTQQKATQANMQRADSKIRNRKRRASWAAPGTSKPCHPSWSFCQEPLTASPPILLQDSLSPVSPCTRGIKHRPQSVFQD